MDELLDEQCRNASSFPLNVAYFDGSARTQEARLARLNGEENRLFGSQERATLRFREMSAGAEGE